MPDQSSPTSSDLSSSHALLMERDSRFRAEVEQLRATFLESWQTYRDSPENPGIIADERDLSLVSDFPMVTLTRTPESASQSDSPARESYELLVDCEGNTRERRGDRLEGIPIREAAPKVGVSESELDAACTAASNGLFNAQPHGERAAAIFHQQPTRSPRLQPLTDRVAVARSAQHSGEPKRVSAPGAQAGTATAPPARATGTPPEAVTRKL